MDKMEELKYEGWMLEELNCTTKRLLSTLKEINKDYDEDDEDRFDSEQCDDVKDCVESLKNIEHIFRKRHEYHHMLEHEHELTAHKVA